MENPYTPCIDGRRRLKGVNAPAGSFTANQPYLLILNEVIETADGVGAAAHTGQHRIRQAAFFFEHLTFDFLRDNRLKVADNRRKRMWPHNGT